MRKSLRLVFLSVLVIGMIVVLSLPASAQESRPGFRGGFYIGALYGSLSGPTFRYPGGGAQLSVSQSKSIPSFVAGYDIGSSYFGAGLRGTYFTASFHNFATPDMPGSLNYVGYADPKYSLFMGDLLLYWAPARSAIFSIYGFLGLGVSTKSYTVSGSVFPEWNGAQSLSEFEYSYGLGLRVRAVRFVSLFGEARLIPGDRMTEFKHFLYSDGIYDYYADSDSYTSHYTMVFAGGVSLHF